MKGKRQEKNQKKNEGLSLTLISNDQTCGEERDREQSAEREGEGLMAIAPIRRRFTRRIHIPLRWRPSLVIWQIETKSEVSRPKTNEREEDIRCCILTHGGMLVLDVPFDNMGWLSLMAVIVIVSTLRLLFFVLWFFRAEGIELKLKAKHKTRPIRQIIYFPR